MKSDHVLIQMYDTMSQALGPSHWWPGETPFEIVIGAILTQNTNWQNVTKAIQNLKAAGVLAAQKMHALPVKELAALIHPAGYYNIKAQRILNFLDFFEQISGYDFNSLQSREMTWLREQILAVNGIGPETADSILLYALKKPIFVVDTYTHRMMHRHGLIWDDINYHEIQTLFMDILPQDVALYNEYHALIVRIGKTWCKKKNALCTQCPLKTFLE